jgi:hypothetical protein
VCAPLAAPKSDEGGQAKSSQAKVNQGKQNQIKPKCFFAQHLVHFWAPNQKSKTDEIQTSIWIKTE